MDFNLNIDKFISDVEERPAIWNFGSEHYSDKSKKNDAWMELCIKYIPNFSEKSVAEKNKAVAQLHRKWKSLRDCFKREHSKQTSAEGKRGSASTSRKPYVYYQQLSFLMKTADSRRRSSRVDDQEQDAAQRRRGKRDNTDFEDDHVENDTVHNVSEQLISYISNKPECEDADRNFALSLVPHFKQMPNEYKLDAQSEILMVLKKYKQKVHVTRE